MKNNVMDQLIKEEIDASTYEYNFIFHNKKFLVNFKISSKG